ncbi:hypothetical protein L2E82_22732 [Cichorium intybus]|uniref:Uncharacterized protein n=1 Tax=Cichorium intybus TaxID=13427 RepID=A0ACB9DYU9_CICIN|nr:hypothetical protein L2E82_22732 [Cichorium intybus]
MVAMAELCYKEEQILSVYLISGSSGAHNQHQYTMANDVHNLDLLWKLDNSTWLYFALWGMAKKVWLFHVLWGMAKQPQVPDSWVYAKHICSKNASLLNSMDSNSWDDWDTDGNMKHVSTSPTANNGDDWAG